MYDWISSVIGVPASPNDILLRGAVIMTCAVAIFLMWCLSRLLK